MASISETGHAKNVANLDDLISFVLGYGTAYNPSKPSIKSDALQTLSDYAKKAIDGVNAALPGYSNAVAAREAAFAPLSKLVTRVVNALKATDTTKQVDESANTLAHKIQGKRAIAKKTEAEKKAEVEAGKETVEISSSQMSYDSRLENLDKFIKLLASVSLYAPNEEDLKVTFTNHPSDLSVEISPAENSQIAISDWLKPDKNGTLTYNLNIGNYILISSSSTFFPKANYYPSIGTK